MYQLIDFINTQCNYAYTDRLDKINFNIGQVESLKNNINELKRTKKNAFSCMTVLGRWVIIYQANIENDDDTIVYFIDFRIDIETLESYKIFSVSAINGIKQIQNEYSKVFNDKLDEVELTFAEPFEKIVKPNLFFCDNDDLVLSKAKQLGVLPIIETLNEGDRVKVLLVDDKVISDGKPTSAYAFIHFGGHSEENKHENGFAYIKLHDLLKNLDKIDDFQKALEGFGGKFDRAFFIEKFTKERLN